MRQVEEPKMLAGKFVQPLRYRVQNWIRNWIRTSSRRLGLSKWILFVCLLPAAARAEFNCGSWVWFNDEMSTALEADICDTLRVEDQAQDELVAERDAALAGNCHPEDLWEDVDGIGEDRALYRKLTRRLKVELRRIRKHRR
jgi:hypothetical protein